MEKIRFAGCFFPMFASIARKPVVWKRVPPARLCAPKSARCLCKTMFATAADIVLFPARSALSIVVRNRCPTPAAPSSALSVMIARRAGSHRRAQRFVQPNRSSSGGSMICARVRHNVCSNCENTGTPMRNFTIPSTLLCAAPTRSSSSWVNLRHMVFRQSRRCQQFI